MDYLATPYSDDDPRVEQHRYQVAVEIAADLMSQGLHVISPIVHCHPIAMEADLPTDHVWWQNYDNALLDPCDRLLVAQMDGWEKSKGIKAEIERSAGKPILKVYFDYDTHMWVVGEAL